MYENNGYEVCIIGNSDYITSRIDSMFRNAERTFTTAECMFTTAERRFTTAEHRMKYVLIVVNPLLLWLVCTYSCCFHRIFV